MEAAAFVLLQLHETNKHATGHKETSRRPEAESGVWEPKKKKRAKRLRTLRVPPACQALPVLRGVTAARSSTGFFSPCFCDTNR